jgi:pimeloyl-ACP methyl ester carboxylesterase
MSDHHDVSPVPRSVEASGPKGTVVLLHGLAANSWLMKLLARRLQSQGYDVTNWGYWSIGSLAKVIDTFTSRFAEIQAGRDPQRPLHIVAHSMGAIITRAVLSRVELPSLRRVVMLSPPNGGSFVASMVGPYLRWLAPMVDELADREDSFVNTLPRELPASVDVGVIAAEWDYVLHEVSTHLDCECDHIVLPSRHSGLVLRRTVADQIQHFLEYGCFHREDCGECAQALLASPTENS